MHPSHLLSTGKLSTGGLPVASLILQEICGQIIESKEKSEIWETQSPANT